MEEPVRGVQGLHGVHVDVALVSLLVHSVVTCVFSKTIE